MALSLHDRVMAFAMMDAYYGNSRQGRSHPDFASGDLRRRIRREYGMTMGQLDQELDYWKRRQPKNPPATVADVLLPIAANNAARVIGPASEPSFKQLADKQRAARLAYNPHPRRNLETD